MGPATSSSGLVFGHFTDPSAPGSVSLALHERGFRDRSSPEAAVWEAESSSPSEVPSHDSTPSAVADYGRDRAGRGASLGRL
jgi:hypothetical protein